VILRKKAVNRIVREGGSMGHWHTRGIQLALRQACFFLKLLKCSFEDVKDLWLSQNYRDCGFKIEDLRCLETEAVSAKKRTPNLLQPFQ
jgi:hypothetical protein